MMTVPGTINGTAQNGGFTTPTFTTAASSTTFPNGKGYVVTAKGGTQPGTVDVHSASRPFSMLATRPANVRVLPPVNASGILPNVPVNVYGLSTRKGVTPLAGQAAAIAGMKTTINVPAGSDLADPANLRAMISAHIGALQQMSAEIGETSLSGEI
jgi:hypothetical protein